MLKLMSKTPVKFLMADDLAETAVVLSPDDDQETLVSKLGRVLDLVGWPALPMRQPGAALAAAQVEFVDTGDRFDTVAAEQALKANGWEDADLDELPEA